MESPEAYLIALSERLFPYLWEDGFAALSPEEQVFVCAWEVEAEVNNGGFHQFFFNSAGDRTIETVAALEVIGAPYTASLVRRAADVLGKQPPADRNARVKLLLALDDAGPRQFDALDKLFFEYRENPSQLLFAFVQQHHAEIRSPTGPAASELAVLRATMIPPQPAHTPLTWLRTLDQVYWPVAVLGLNAWCWGFACMLTLLGVDRRPWAGQVADLPLLANSAALFISFIGLGRRSKATYLFAVAVALLNLIWVATWPLGFFGPITGVLDVVALGLLVSMRARFLPSS